MRYLNRLLSEILIITNLLGALPISLHAESNNGINLYRDGLKLNEGLPNFEKLKPKEKTLKRGGRFDEHNSIAFEKYDWGISEYIVYRITCQFGGSKRNYVIYVREGDNGKLFRRFNLFEDLKEMKYRANDESWKVFKCPDLA